MECSVLLNSIGLFFSIVGTVFLICYGLPSKLHLPPKALLDQGLTEKEEIENEKIKKLARLGVFFLMGGFILQLMSNFI